MATQSTAALLSGSGGSVLLPRQVSSDIWQKATAQSIVPTLSTTTPMIIGDNTFPTLTKRPAATIVGELQNKKQSELAVGSKTVRPIKAQVGLEFSMEAIESNPVGILGILSQELSAALARQVDLAVLHGRVADTGGQISGAEYVNQTTKRVELSGPDTSDVDLWEGYGLAVADGAGFTGFAMDPRFVYSLAVARDKDGKRLNPDLNIGSSVTSYAGQKVLVSTTVSGQVDESADTKVRAFGGDWDALRFGYALNIPVTMVPYGDPFGNGDLQRRNARAYLAEVIFGWAIMDPAAFVAYDDAAA